MANSTVNSSDLEGASSPDAPVEVTETRLPVTIFVLYFVYTGNQP